MEKQRRPRGTGCLYKHPKSRFWYIKYHRNGRPYHESTGTTDRRKAEKLLARRVGEISTGLFIGPQSERIRYEELAQDLLNYYLTNGRKSLAQPKEGGPYVPGEPHLRKFFAGYKAVDITTSSIREYVLQRQKQGVSNGTINRSLAALKLMFNLAKKAGKLREVPFIEMLKENNARSGFVDDKQYNALKEAITKVEAEMNGSLLWLRTMIAVGYTYGWRRGELTNLKVEQVDLLNREIRLEPGTTKNNEGRTVRMTDEVFQLVQACISGKKSDYVLTRAGQPIGDFRKLWTKICNRAGLPGLLFHDLRRSAVRNLERAGVPRSQAMKLTGHKTEAVYRRYAIVNKADIEEAVGKLEIYHKNSSTMVKVDPDSPSVEEGQLVI